MPAWTRPSPGVRPRVHRPRSGENREREEDRRKRFAKKPLKPVLTGCSRDRDEDGDNVPVQDRALHERLSLRRPI